MKRHMWAEATALMLAAASLVVLAGRAAVAPQQLRVSLALDEPFRPQYHVSVPENWANDPNGLVYYDGEYHLFYQHNPDDTASSPMYQYAVSADLVNWIHLPIAPYPDELGTIFSGSVVIDWNNTAGFGEEAMVAPHP